MKRWQVIVIAVVVIASIAVVAGYRMAVQLLQDKVVDAPGPGSRLTEPRRQPDRSRRASGAFQILNAGDSR
jgi:hypothetical protein